MSVPIPSKITAEILDLEILFSLIQILGDDASGGDVHGDGLGYGSGRAMFWRSNTRK